MSGSKGGIVMKIVSKLENVVGGKIVRYPSMGNFWMCGIAEPKRQLDSACGTVSHMAVSLHSSSFVASVAFTHYLENEKSLNE